MKPLTSDVDGHEGCKKWFASGDYHRMCETCAWEYGVLDDLSDVEDDAK